MSERSPRMGNGIPHVCSPEFVAEGEVVCFECGAAYIYSGTYNEEELGACREEIEARRPPSGVVGTNDPSPIKEKDVSRG